MQLAAAVEATRAMLEAERAAHKQLQRRMAEALSRAQALALSPGDLPPAAADTASGSPEMVYS